jgi:uncharacterized protein YcfJ
MKRLLTATVLVTGALAAQAQTMIDTARVRSAEPQYESTRVPRQECSNRWQPEHGGRHRQGYQEQDAYQERSQDAERRYGGAIVGGLAGGVLGNQVGGGNGKVAATAIGAVLGAFAGDSLENRNARPAQVYQTGGREVNRCQTVFETQSQLTGYQVVYEYRGQNYSTFMRNNPGNRLKVRVSVEPIEE